MKKKILINLLIIIFIICCNVLPIYGVDISSIINAKKDTAIDNELVNLRGNALGVAQAIGVCIAVCMLIFVAIKYITSSPSERADVKKYAIPFVIGAVCIFAAVGITQLVSVMATEMANKVVN